MIILMFQAGTGKNELPFRYINIIVLNCLI